MKSRTCLWWLRSTRSHKTHTYRHFSCSGACPEILQLMVRLQHTSRKPASHLSTRGTPGILLTGPVEGSELEFLNASRNPWATRDCRHLCRSPLCSPCFLHIRNLLVDVLNKFFIPVCPEDSEKNSSTALSWSRIPVQVSDHFPDSTSTTSRPKNSSP